MRKQAEFIVLPVLAPGLRFDETTTVSVEGLDGALRGDAPTSPHKGPNLMYETLAML
jgi:hypothetical protein